MKLLLLDSNSLINRAFYALPTLQDRSGRYTGALFGFVSMLSKLIKSEHPTQYSEEVMHGVEENIPQVKGASDDGGSDSVVVNADDELIDQAISIIVQTGQASTSFLQRKLKLGFSRASRIMDEIEEMGIIGPQEGSKPREVLISQQEWIEMRARR